MENLTKEELIETMIKLETEAEQKQEQYEKLQKENLS